MESAISLGGGENLRSESGRYPCLLYAQSSACRCVVPYCVTKYQQRKDAFCEALVSQHSLYDLSGVAVLSG